MKPGDIVELTQMKWKALQPQHSYRKEIQMPLNYTEICELIEQESWKMLNFRNVSSSSLDITLGRDILLNFS